MVGASIKARARCLGFFFPESTRLRSRSPPSARVAPNCAGAVQTSIITEGFRSLAEGEQVEFFVESGDDGRTKAVQVTGPGGAPPQVRSLPSFQSPVFAI